MAWASLVFGAGVLVLAARAVRRHRRADRVSPRWLREIDQRTSRVDFVSVSWRWPVNKIVNEHPAFQRARLRRSA